MRRANKIALAGVMGAIASALLIGAVYLPVTLTLSVVASVVAAIPALTYEKSVGYCIAIAAVAAALSMIISGRFFYVLPFAVFFRAVYNCQSVCRQKQIVRALQMAYIIRRPGNRARASGIAHLFVFFGELGALHVARMVFVGVFACAASGACAV